MSATVCQNFVQNAWKKDLCSNCFKQKQDHTVLDHICSSDSMETYNERYMSQSTAIFNSQSHHIPPATTWKGLALQKHYGTNGFVSNGNGLKIDTSNQYGHIQICNGTTTMKASTNGNGLISNGSNDKGKDNSNDVFPPSGILKFGRRKSSTGSVGFREEAPLVIGFGGDCVGESSEESAEEEIEEEAAAEEEEEETDDFGDFDSLENSDASDDDREFARMTERNTEFNSVHRNLLFGVKEETQLGAKYNGTQPITSAAPGSGSVYASGGSREAILKPAPPPEEEKSGDNRFLLPRATIRPFCRESVTSILDAKATAAAAPAVHYDEDGHVVIDKMAPPIKIPEENKECVAYEVSPISKMNINPSPPAEDVPPELPSSPPPDDTEQPLAKSTGGFTSSSTIKGFPHIVVSEKVIPKKNKPKVPMKPKSSPGIVLEVPAACIENETSVIHTLEVNSRTESETSSQSAGEELYQDTSSEPSVSGEDKKDNLTFQDKVASLTSNLDFNRRSTKRQAPLPPQQPERRDPSPSAVERPSGLSFRDSQHTSDLPSPTDQLAALLRNPVKRSTHMGVHENPDEATDENRVSVIEQNCTPILSTNHKTAAVSPPLFKKNIFQSNNKVRISHSLDSSTTKILSTPMPEDSKDHRKLKGRFSLKKFLKFGKDGEDGTSNGRSKNGAAFTSATLDKRMKLEILHPMDLANMPPSLPNSTVTTPNGEWDPTFSEVSVIGIGYTSLDSSFDFCNNSESTVSSNISTSHASSPPGSARNKPPPPPRVKGGDIGNQNKDSNGCKPMRPPPPSRNNMPPSSPVLASSPETTVRRSEGIGLEKTNEAIVNGCQGDTSSSGGGEYANLGDVRIVLVPKKPGRNSPGTLRKESTTETPQLENGNVDDIPGENISLERNYYEPPSILSSSSDLEKEMDQEQITATNSETPAGRTKRHSRQTKAAGMVFMDSGIGEISSGDSDAASITSGEVHPQATSSPKMDLNNLYAEVIHKAKTCKQRQMVPKDLSEFEDTAPPLPPVCTVLHVESSSNSSDNTVTVYPVNGETSSPSRESSPEVGPPPPPSQSVPAKNRSKCLSLRQGRSIIHRNLEENYGAVVNANLETLAQLVEQVSSSKICPNLFDGLRESPLRWSDFKVDASPMATLPHFTFYKGIWGSHVDVTLLVTQDIFPVPFPAKAPFLLSPIATFQDFIPTDFLSYEETETPNNGRSPSKDVELIHGMVWIFPPMTVQSLPEFCQTLQSSMEEDIENFSRVVCFILLQLISALKHLQAQGIEEVGFAPEWMVVMCNDAEDCNNFRLAMIGGNTQSFPHADENIHTLCACAQLVLGLLLTGQSDLKEPFEDVPELISSNQRLRAIADTLKVEKVTSLSKVKAILEYVLFGPGESSFDSCKSNELALQRWLDLERATVLNSIIRSKGVHQIEMSVFEEFHLLFLIRTSARSLREAATMVSPPVSVSTA